MDEVTNEKQIETKKIKLLLKLQNFQAQGYRLSRDYSIKSSYQDLEREYIIYKKLIQRHKQRDSIEFMISGINSCISYVNNILSNNLLLKYFDTETINNLTLVFKEDNDEINQEFYRLTGFTIDYYNKLTHLQKCVIMSIKYPKLIKYMKDYLDNQKTMIPTIKMNDDDNFDIASSIIKIDIDSRKRNSLHYCVALSQKYDMIEIIKLLIEYHINVDQKDDLGNTPLFYASNYQVIEILIKNNANPHIKNLSNETPFSYQENIKHFVTKIENDFFKRMDD